MVDVSQVTSFVVANALPLGAGLLAAGLILMLFARAVGLLLLGVGILATFAVAFLVWDRNHDLVQLALVVAGGVVGSSAVALASKAGAMAFGALAFLAGWALLIYNWRGLAFLEGWEGLALLASVWGVTTGLGALAVHRLSKAEVPLKGVNLEARKG